jgi:molecular chaperone DnaK
VSEDEPAAADAAGGRDDDDIVDAEFEDLDDNKRA